MASELGLKHARAASRSIGSQRFAQKEFQGQAKIYDRRHTGLGQAIDGKILG